WRDRADRQPRIRARPRASRGGESTSGRRVSAILVAEDDAISQRVLVATLAKLGHEVTAVSDGRQAWAALEARHYPIVISDWMMPEMDGLDLCRALRAQRRPKYTYVLLL